MLKETFILFCHTFSKVRREWQIAIKTSPVRMKIKRFSFFNMHKIWLTQKIMHITIFLKNLNFILKFLYLFWWNFDYEDRSHQSFTKTSLNKNLTKVHFIISTLVSSQDKTLNSFFLVNHVHLWRETTKK